MNNDIRKKRTLHTALGLLVLAVVVLIILGSGANIVTPEKIERRLQQFADNFSREAAAGGKGGKFTHGAIIMQGWGYSKHAIVDNINLELADKAPGDAQKWTLSTDKMVVNSDPAAVNTLLFTLPDSVSVSENGQKQAVIGFSAPLGYSYYEGNEQKKNYAVMHVFHLPPQITLTQLSGGQEQPASKLILSYDANPVLRIKEQPELGASEAKYMFGHIRVAGPDGELMSIAHLSSDLSENPVAGNHMDGTYKLTLTDLSVPGYNKMAKPYSLDTDVHYNGDAAPVAEAGKPAPNFGNGQLQLHKIVLSGETFKLKGSGVVNTATDDPLPFGNVVVDISNVPGFLASDLVPAQFRGTVAAALQKIASQSPAAQPIAPQPAAPQPATPDQVSITFKRDKGGLFYAGNVTIEELAASVLSDMLKPASSAMPQSLPVTQAPAGQLPVQTPQMVTPQSVAPQPGNAAPQAIVPAKPVASAPAINGAPSVPQPVVSQPVVPAQP